MVCGDDPLAHRLVEELATRYGEDVTVILPSKRRNHGPQISRLPGVRVIEAERLDEEAFRAARLASAHALALVRQDDVGNIHAALRAKELNRGLRLVIRMFNMNLGHGVRVMFDDCLVLSDAGMAAPAFVAAALGEVAPSHIRLPGRTLFVAKREDVAADHVVCGLADTSAPGGPDLLPEPQDRANLVLAVANSIAPVARRVRPRRRNPLAVLVATFRALVNRRLRIVLLSLLGLLVVGTVSFKFVNRLSWLKAMYLTLMTAAGSANPALSGRAGEQVTQVVVTLVGVALLPVVIAAVVEAVVSARLRTGGGVPQGLSNHVIVVGIGNVGTRVIEQLHDLGVAVVAVDKSEGARGLAKARQLGIPVIMGDSSRFSTLRRARVEQCRALVTVTNDDVLNLETALNGRSVREDLRVVLRVFDGDLAERVQRQFRIDASRSVSSLAAPAFAAAMLERKVITTIPVGRKVLLVAELPIAEGSPLAGAPVRTAQDPGEARVIGLLPYRDHRPVWSPAPDRKLVAEDRLIVLATRGGLGELLANISPPDGTAPPT